MTVRSAWLTATGQTREDTRLTPLGAVTPVNTVQGQSGILPGSSEGRSRVSGFQLSGTSALSATMSPGRAVIQGLGTQGAYPVTLAENETLTFSAGHPQFARIDLVCLRVYDDLYDSSNSGRTEAVIEVVEGKAETAPTAPATPDLALPLYRVTVPAGASAGSGGIPWTTALTDLRTATVAVGGILPVYNNTANGAYVGQYRDSANGLQRWDGSAWTAYPAVPGWQNWTPTWTTVTGNAKPSFGNATLNCRYIQMGPTVHLIFNIAFGTTTNFGAGATGADNWAFALPVAATSALQCIGFAELTYSGGGRVVGRLHCSSKDAFGIEVSTGRPDAVAVTNNGLIDAITPWTWANTHAIRGTATYEVAG
ncbi:hypothetical protein [Peterkaempfera bronchialis]|uniref:Uncharacterized protein n=1 Tax=Peterkaempfera bronchialis TaxID=2126346 RepID=A0A345SWF7_9ACTN|nr:hypothetical protein [Peterkaempfera bronchialis]AXI78062.1 hypothetical protein C7M71_012030 [Peterkaempfera bronchialis]